MKLIFSLGPFNIHFFGLMVAIASMVGIGVALMEAKRKGLDQERILEVCLYALVGGVVGARLMYILVYDPAHYLQNPADIIMISNGGLSIHGGIVGGALAAIIYIKKNKLPIWKVADTVAPGLILAQGIGRVGCDVFGKVMSSPLPWGITYNGNLVHPAQAYEFILDYLLFSYLWQKRKDLKYDGQIFVHYLMIFALIRGVVEFSRINPSVWGVFTVSHVLSIVMVAAGTIIAIYLKRNKPLKTDIGRKRTNIWGTLLFVIILILFSLIIFYGVQG
ncbi:MAG: prolipoprotein diacylglyceryl transferase [Firmicutes bacterium]|nr:prolipoprotein diacylglyceryl transferase [Bacillota bacterium]